MKELLKQIQKDFDIANPNSTFLDVCDVIDYIQDTYIDEYNDLFTCLAFKN